MNKNFKDINGQKFGMLTVISFAEIRRGKAFWNCKCKCGNTSIVAGDKLRSGRTKSCGCLQTKHRKEGIHKTHGMTNTKIYTIWSNMRSRCMYKGNSMYRNYGGRGITVCDEWLQFENFQLWAITSGYSEGLSLERIDVNGNYEPDNCKWIPLCEQSLNQRRSHMVEAFGKTQTIREWADVTGISYDTIERRLNAYGWDAEKAVSVKPHKRG